MTVLSMAGAVRFERLRPLAVPEARRILFSPFDRGAPNFSFYLPPAALKIRARSRSACLGFVLILSKNKESILRYSLIFWQGQSETRHIHGKSHPCFILNFVVQMKCYFSSYIDFILAPFHIHIIT